MSRVINTDGPGKRRNQLMRTCAELLRRLSQKQENYISGYSIKKN